MLATRLRTGQRLAGTAQGFVLWAAEHIRRAYAGGQLTWEFVFGGLNIAPPQYPFIHWLADTGLNRWQRQVRRGEAGHREFLYSLLAEGGLPDAALAEEGRYRAVLLRLINEIEAEGSLGHAVAEAVARRCSEDLPQVLRSEDQARLLADFALALIGLRAALPPGQPPELAEAWLDAQRPGWRQSLPLRMSQHALEALIRPALAVTKSATQRVGPPVLRELRRGGGGGWGGVARVVEHAFLPEALLSTAAGQRTRLVAETGAAFLAQPEPGGWRLNRTAGSPFVALAPDEAMVLSAHADGRQLGEVVLDGGLPSADEAPSLWRPVDATAAEPDVLVPLSGRGQTRASQSLAPRTSRTSPHGGRRALRRRTSRRAGRLALARLGAGAACGRRPRTHPLHRRGG